MSSADTGQEDRRAASSLATSLSSYVITAALAVLGAQAVVATFVMDRRTGLGSFYVVSALGVAALVGSIIFGGRGIWEIVSSGYGGNWKVGPSGQKFNVQAMLALVGAVLVVVSAFLGHPKPSPKAAASVSRDSMNATTTWASGIHRLPEEREQSGV